MTGVLDPVDQTDEQWKKAEYVLYLHLYALMFN